MSEPRNLTMHQARARMEQGALTAEALVLSCLERIEAREPEVRAWVMLDREGALNSAREMDRDARAGRWRGPLHGMPIAIKDIFHVQGMQTCGGTEAYEAHTADADADSVRCLREAGAIILGKTVSTPFAYLGSPKTRNPWNTAHTAGGSSTGSGAAVGDRMCMAALGTQTGGSTLRPASYNGIIGFKPSFGKIPTGGVLELSWLMDHVGTLARSIDDTNLLWRLMEQGNGAAPAGQGAALPPLPKARKPAKIWRVRGFFESEASSECLRMMDEVCELLAREGAAIVERPLPVDFDEHRHHWQVIMATEAAHNHKERFAARERYYPKGFANLVREGQAYSALEYIAATRYRTHLQNQMAPLLADVDAALMPTAPAPPPDPSSSGNPMYLSPWTLIGIPAISLPASLAPGNLPLGIQLISGFERDDDLLQTSKWCEALIGFDKMPD